MPPVFKKGASLKGPSFFENRAPPPPCLFGDPGGCLAKCPRAVCPFRVVAVGWRLARLGAAPRVQPTREEKFALFLHGRCGGWLRGLGQARVRLLLLALRASPAPARQGRAVVWCHQALAGELLLSPGPAARPVVAGPALPRAPALGLPRPPCALCGVLSFVFSQPFSCACQLLANNI